jgi:subtilisin-like proprotein convertase family protein
MKRITLVTAVVVLALVRSAQADLVQTFNFTGGVIPDGSTVGRSFTENVSGLPGYDQITDVNVGLNLSGGWNGDLYAYLVHGSGFAVLLNRVGVTTDGSPGFGTAGMNVMLDGSAVLNIHDVSGPGAPPTYSYQPDGRNISPLSSGSVLGSTTPTALLSSFNGLDLNGNWTLFLADVSGGAQSTLESWTLEIAAVPEPGTMVEGGLAVLFLGGLVGLCRFRRDVSLRPA